MDKGLTLTYTYTPGISATPLPAALSLFATGTAGLGFTTTDLRAADRDQRKEERPPCAAQ